MAGPSKAPKPGRGRGGILIVIGSGGLPKPPKKGRKVKPPKPKGG